MLKRSISFVLIVTILSANFSRFFVYAGFELNKKYITAELCENLNKPWLHCDGHCYFMKKIEQARDNEKKQATRDNFTKTAVSFFNQPAQVSFIAPKLLTHKKGSCPAYTRQYSSRYIATVFQPPKFAA